MFNTGLVSKVLSLSQIRHMYTGGMQYVNMQKKKRKIIAIYICLMENMWWKLTSLVRSLSLKEIAVSFRKESKFWLSPHVNQIIIVCMQENVSWKLGFLQIVTLKRPINTANPWKHFQLGLSNLLYVSTLGKYNSLAVSLSLSIAYKSS